MLLLAKEKADSKLFTEALSLLKNQEKEQNYSEAKMKLQNLVKQYPGSQWTAGAQALLLTLDNISALQSALKKEKQKPHGNDVKLTKEVSELKDNIKQTEERYLAELGKLQQENDQLKKDIQQLKNLEIHLEKREKMLR